MAANAKIGNIVAFQIYGRVFKDFGDGDNITIVFPNELAGMKTGKNGSTLAVQNETGRQGDVSIRFVRGSEDDKFLNTQLIQQKNDFAATAFASGEVVMRVGDGSGNISQDRHILNAGMIVKNPDMKDNAEGDTEAAIVIWEMKFGSVERAIS